MFPLYCILDTTLALERGYAPVDLARLYLEGGARLLQLRAKDAPSGQALEWADAVCAAARDYGAEVIINDRADLALMSGASGVHVGQTDFPPAAVRALAPPAFVIGRSTHTIAQLQSAAAEPVDYVAMGPVFATRTKDTAHPPGGLPMVAQAAGLAGKRPLVAIGGITLETARAVMAAGAASVAVISDLLATGDPSARVRDYLRLLAPLP